MTKGTLLPFDPRSKLIVTLVAIVVLMIFGHWPALVGALGLMIVLVLTLNLGRAWLGLLKGLGFAAVTFFIILWLTFDLIEALARDVSSADHRYGLLSLLPDHCSRGSVECIGQVGCALCLCFSSQRITPIRPCHGPPSRKHPRCSASTRHSSGGWDGNPAPFASTRRPPPHSGI